MRKLSLKRAALVALLFVATAGEGVAFVPFGTVELTADFSLDGPGTNVDSIAFWEAPNPADTLLFVTAKGNQLVEVWEYPFAGNGLAPLTHPSFGVGTQVNGVAVDQAAGLLFVSVSAPVSTVSVFSLPGLGFLGQIVAGAANLGPEPNLALLEAPGGALSAYVSDETSVFVYDADSGAPLGSFAPLFGLETLAADSFYQALYIPDENGGSGVYAYDPFGTPFERAGTNQFGGGGIFDADAEGILVYTCPSDGSFDTGTGWIVVADQTDPRTDFEFFDRSTWAHLGRLRVKDVNLTDGIGSTQRALPAYPLGVFVAIDDDRKAYGVGWQRILAATGLQCEPGCSDGFDNDEDGYADFPDDLGCAGAADESEKDETGTWPCDDGVSNEAGAVVETASGPQALSDDGLVDLDDPGCGSDPFTAAPAPAANGGEYPQCQDGLENDADGGIDFDRGVSVFGAPQSAGDDRHCDAFPDRREKREDACGLGAEPALLLVLAGGLRRFRARCRASASQQGAQRAAGERSSVDGARSEP